MPKMSSALEPEASTAIEVGGRVAVLAGQPLLPGRRARGDVDLGDIAVLVADRRLPRQVLAGRAHQPGLAVGDRHAGDRVVARAAVIGQGVLALVGQVQRQPGHEAVGTARRGLGLVVDVERAVGGRAADIELTVVDRQAGDVAALQRAQVARRALGEGGRLGVGDRRGDPDFLVVQERAVLGDDTGRDIEAAKHRLAAFLAGDHHLRAVDDDAGDGVVVLAAEMGGEQRLGRAGDVGGEPVR
jgi:hypothetical protein